MDELRKLRLAITPVKMTPASDFMTANDGTEQIMRLAHNGSAHVIADDIIPRATLLYHSFNLISVFCQH